MKKKYSNIIIAAIFIIGLSLLLYPTIANKWNTYRQSQLISNYDDKVSQMEKDGTIDYEAEWKKAQDYNNALVPMILPDSFAVADAKEERDSSYESCLNITGDGIMGTVEIPKIDVKLPIYHYTTEEVLKNAAGHLEGSSLPIGGESTHSVISAHRGLPSAILFTDLDKLKKGDHFMIHVLDDVLCYEVDKISVVKPDDTSNLNVVEGEDLMTLLTCTPYGVNTERLLVRGHRVPYEETYKEEKESSISLETNYVLWVIIGLVITAALIGGMYIRERRKNHEA
ncbi:MAG: class C sortase [Faecalicatena sp.]|uniref:class C sortase n=1 Tax=Faecalicatena sp. TaxID=2005360 RepID=UPI0025890F3F|nr:class C sortase [Faecalicatena sp.]MCI6466738.1 class C sortase [Faecalicatena sp.]MCI7181977.1 class C sortase [Lachnospiraceae bacterium]MDY5619128.1 class C sortase [Lachnospiraceae bacterium]